MPLRAPWRRQTVGKTDVITATALQIFPQCPTYGFTSRPTYLVKAILREGGYERRDRKWAEPLHFYDGMPIGEKPQADIEAIAEFFHAMGGTTERFLFKDYADFKSCRLDETVATADQPFALTDDSPQEYQLVKAYTVGSLQTLRTIRHPIGATLRVENDSGVEQAASRWTIDEDTGILTTGGTFVGTPGHWGGEFYVPCNFAADIAIEISNFKIMSLTCSIKELRPEVS